MKDYYKILGVDINSTEDEIKAAYRKIAIAYHPDKNPGNKDAEEKFREATEAYETLKDPTKRGVYDGLRSSSGSRFKFNMSDIFSEFEDMFTGRDSYYRPPVSRGPDMKIELKIGLKEVLLGDIKRLRVKMNIPCPDCNGIGGTSKVICPNCQGRGYTFGQPCSTCMGTGYSFSNPCNRCSGTGVIPGEKDIDVNIQRGSFQGLRIVKYGVGNAGYRGGIHGDLIIDLTYIDDPIFKRVGDDLTYVVYISIPTAVLGGKLDFRSPDRTKTLHIDIAPGTQTGSGHVISGEGIPHMSSPGRGNLIVAFRVYIPGVVSDSERRLLESLISSPNFNKRG